jgi:hypothetical protein
MEVTDKESLTQRLMNFQDYYQETASVTFDHAMITA